MSLIQMPERFELFSCSLLEAQATSRERLERSARPIAGGVLEFGMGEDRIDS